MPADVDFSVVAGGENAAAVSSARVPSGSAVSVGRSWSIWLVAGLALAFFNERALTHLALGDAPVLGLENGYLENIQLLALLLAAVVFAYAGAKGGGAVRGVGTTLALCVTVVFLREIDLERLDGIPSVIWWTGTRTFQYMLYGGLGVALLAHIVRERRYFFDGLRLGLRWQAWPFIAAIALMLVAEFALDGSDELNGQFWEELAEANAYFLLVAAAWVHAGLIGDPVYDRVK